MYAAICNTSLYALDRCLISFMILLPCPVTVDTLWKQTGVHTNSLAARTATAHYLLTHSQSTTTLPKLLKEEHLFSPILNVASAGKSTSHSPSARPLERTRLPSHSPELNTPLPTSTVVRAGSSVPHFALPYLLCRVSLFPLGKVFDAIRSEASAGALAITRDVTLENDATAVGEASAPSDTEDRTGASRIGAEAHEYFGW